MKSRREFLRISGTGALVSCTPYVPSIFGDTAQAAGTATDDRVLVVIQLDGGNDGINTVVPFADDGYAKARIKLRQKTSELYKLNDHVGLHRSMKPAFDLFEDNRLSIIQGVGYPNPNRSHFRSMKIWHTASLDHGEHVGNGWLGTALDQQLASSAARAKAPLGAQAIFVGTQELPPALWGRRSSAISLSKTEDLQLELNSMQEFDTRDSGLTDGMQIQQFVLKQAVAARATGRAFAAQNSAQASTAQYPATRLANQLSLVAKLLRGGHAARVYYTLQPGYDTHGQQEFDHASLLGEFSGAIQAFLDDLQSAGLDDRVVVLAFSEFGRRVAENDTAGTDHGSAGPVFLAGSPVRGGLVGETPDLTDLVDGDLRSSIDFRQIYSTILQEWLEIEPAKVMQTGFDRLPLFA